MDDNRWIFLILLAVAIVGWKMFLQKYGFRRKD